MTIENQLREYLLPVFGIDSIDEIPADVSLVVELGADSLDFVEIVYLIEMHFGVVLKSSELVLSGVQLKEDELFVEGKLTEDGAELLKKQLPDGQIRFEPGMTKVDLFQSITVRDLANIIKQRQKQ